MDNNDSATSSNASIPQSPDSRPEDLDNVIFSDLSVFGLDEAKKTAVFEVKAEVKGPEEQAAAKNREIIEKSLYFKTFKCPICLKDSLLPAVRSSTVRLKKTDTDFMPLYGDPNPLLYFVEFCRHCGFASVPAGIKNLTTAQKALIREKICATWKFDKQYDTYYDTQTAIEIHKLALYNAVVAGLRESVKAVLSLHIGWLYRIAGDDAGEATFLKTAREGFERAYNGESGNIGGLDKCRQQYLIGELLRRTGDPLGALNWYKLVLLDRNSKQTIKDMARTQKDTITALYYSGT